MQCSGSKLRVLLASLAALSTTSASVAAGQQFGSPTDQLLEHVRQSSTTDPNMTVMRTPGDYRFGFVYDGISRTYYVHIPDSYDGRPMPMLIALHRENGEGEFDQSNDLIRKSNKAGFVVVSPNGYPLVPGTPLSFPGGTGATWNAGRCCRTAQSHNADDVGFIREVIARVERQTTIDSHRIFATGFSNGAMMAWRLACESPEIRAIAPVAGTDNTITCRPAHPVGVVEFHAIDDHDVPFTGGKGGGSIGSIELTSVAASQAKWVEINHAETAATRVLTKGAAYCDVHRSRAGGAAVELCVLDKGRHTWPGPTRPINANDLMWTFFSSL